MLGLGLGFTSPTVLGGSGMDADALALFAAWTAAGAPPSDADKLRAGTLITALKNAGLWSSITVLQVYGVHAQVAALVNWKAPGTYDATLSGAPTFTAYQGFATDGVDDAVAAFNPSGLLSQDSFHVALWVTDTAQNAVSHFGWYDGTDGITINTRYTTDEIQVRASVIGADVGVVTGIVTAAGLTAVNRSGAGATQCYRNGVAQTLSNSTAASVTINNHVLNIGQPSGSFSVTHPLCLVAGASLSAESHTALYNALNTYETSLPWSPMDLGAALKAWWSADDHGTARMVDDGAGLISSWTDKVGGMAVTAVTAARPTWTASAFNSVYAGLTFDGTANCLASTTLTTLPTGATSGEIWLAVSNTESIAGTRRALGYGSSGASGDRNVQKVLSGTTKLQISDSTVNTTDAASGVLFTGPHVVSGNWAGTAMGGRIDGRAATGGTIATLNTGTTRLRIGASQGTTAALFWLGVVHHAMVTTTLTAGQREQLEAWLAWDAGLQANLPVGHTYKSAPP